MQSQAYLSGPSVHLHARIEPEPLAGLNGVSCRGDLGKVSSRPFICFSLCSVIVTHILFVFWGYSSAAQCCPVLLSIQASLPVGFSGLYGVLGSDMDQSRAALYPLLFSLLEMFLFGRGHTWQLVLGCSSKN